MNFGNKELVLKDIKKGKCNKLFVLSILSLKKKSSFLTKRYDRLNAKFLDWLISRNGKIRYRKFFPFLKFLRYRIRAQNGKLFRYYRNLNYYLILNYFGFRLRWFRKYKEGVFSNEGVKIFKEKMAKGSPSRKGRKKFRRNNFQNPKSSLVPFWKLSLFKKARVNLSLPRFRMKDVRFIRATRYKKSWFLHLQPTFSNFMLSLTTIKGKVITSFTSGSAGIKGRKRYKTSPKALELIFKRIVPYFKLFSIRKLTVVTYRYRARGLPILLNSLRTFGMKLVGLEVRIVRAHNGVRPRKSKRR